MKTLTTNSVLCQIVLRALRFGLLGAICFSVLGGMAASITSLVLISSFQSLPTIAPAYAVDSRWWIRGVLTCSEAGLRAGALGGFLVFAAIGLRNFRHCESAAVLRTAFLMGWITSYAGLVAGAVCGLLDVYLLQSLRLDSLLYLTPLYFFGGESNLGESYELIITAGLNGLVLGFFLGLFIGAWRGGSRAIAAVLQV